jgi:hypothetical protein
MSQFPFRRLQLLGVAILVFAVLVAATWLGSLDHNRRPIHFVRLALVIGVAAGLLGSIKRSGLKAVERLVVGVIIGGFLGFMLPLSFAAVYILLGGASQAAGAFSFFGIFTVPAGIAAGVIFVRKKT